MDNVTTPVPENTMPTSVSGDAVPSVSQEKPSLVSSHIPRWAQIALSCTLVVAILSAALWFGSKKYYQVQPLTVQTSVSEGQNTLIGTTSSLTQNQNSSTTENISSDFDLSPFTISEYNCYIDSVTSQDSKLSTTTLLNLKDGLCTLLKSQGKASIKQSTKVNSQLYRTLTVGVIRSSGYSYLTTFSINEDEQGPYTLTLDTANLLKIINVTKISQVTIKNMAGDHTIVNVSGTDNSGKEIQQYFKEISSRHDDRRFVEIEKNSDGTFSDTLLATFDQDIAHVAFHTPYSSYSSRLGSDIESFTDSSGNTTTAYHKAGCSLEDAYSDMSFLIEDYDMTIGINFGFSSVLNITTARIGYNPAQWGKILEKKSISDFRKMVQKPKVFNSNSPVEILTIGGYQVKHVGPVAADRSCNRADEKSSYDVYQVIKDGAIVTFTIFNKLGTRENQEEIQKLISQVLTTLTFSKR